MKLRTASLHLVEWGSLVGAIIFLVIEESFHPGMNLAVGLLASSWVVRWFRIGRLTRSTPIDIPLLFFIISALIALWVTPERLAGLARLYLFLAAISLFYTLVNSNFRSLEIFSAALIIFAGVFGVLLISQYDWSQGIGRFSFIEKINLWLHQMIPDLGLNLPHWNATRNILASLLALTLPVALVRLSVGKRNPKLSNDGVIARQEPNFSKYWVVGVGSALVILGLTLTESRTPWMVYSLIFVLLMWWVLSGVVKTRLPFHQKTIFLSGLGFAFALIGLVFTLQPRSLSAITRALGPDDYLNRGKIYPQSFRLAQDTPLTGGGLAAFPALYSTYIRVIPHNAFLNEDTGNSAYLNLLVEQGWLGAISYVVVLCFALIAAMRRYGRVREEYKSFVVAGVFGLAFILLQGSVHATLVASRGIPALLIPAGLALSGLKIDQAEPNSDSWGGGLAVASQTRQLGQTRVIASAVALLAVFLALSLMSRSSLLSAWYAGLGAVHMARVELADFPSGEWDDGSHIEALSPAADLYRRALQLNPDNRTAHHRLGLIAMLRRDFSNSVTQLDRAHELDPGHRGVRKALGYSYTWAGQPEEAIAMLAKIPEAKQEMSIYIRWWGKQGRPDLSAHAKAANLLLEEGE
ncbi:MAG: O-antigen ligase family protein [Anaerolineales bacterium]